MISSLYPPFIMGGAEISVRRTVEKLLERGHEVVVITTSPDNELHIEKKDKLKIYRINPLNLYAFYSFKNKSNFQRLIWHIFDLWNPTSYKLVKNILNEEKPDVVHVHNFKGLSSSIFRAINSLKLPTLFTIHDCSLICPRSDLLKGNGEKCVEPNKLCILYGKFQKFSIENNVNCVNAPSQFIINKIKSYGFFKNVKNIKTPLGIEITNKKSKKNYEIIDILYVGSLSLHKGVYILINAFKKLKHENIRLHIIGEGTDTELLKNIADTDKRIIFHGYMDGEELSNFYKKGNITIVPSICYDNSPMVIYESLMHGTPVIGSRIGGIPELIKEGYNGFLFEPGNIDELEKILNNLIKDPFELKKLEKGAFESGKKYDMDIHIKKLEQLYESLLISKNND